MHNPPDAPKSVIKSTFIYKKDGKIIELTEEEAGKVYSDSTYKFVDRKDETISKAPLPPIHDFSISNDSGDYTQDFLNEKGYRLMIVQYDLEHTNTSAQPKLNELVKGLKADNKVKVWAVTGSGSALTENYIRDHQVPYTFYAMDVTVQKTMIRSNPGLILFKDNVVVMIWPSTNLPDKEKLYSYMK
jgi:hypothetical protein